MYAAGRELGVTGHALHWHLDRKTPWFMAIYDACKNQTMDAIENVSVEQAHNHKGGFLDRAMMLRAYRPDRFDRAKVVRVEGIQINQVEALKSMKLAGDIVDAELVDRHKKRKAKRLGGGGR